jgi:ADP-ribose pyrophosphatase YjhB (NUDIX family)
MTWKRRAVDASLATLHFYHRLARPMTLGVRAVVAVSPDAVFLVRHSYVPGWHLPGGGVEPGETCLDALDRELREEGRIELRSPPELVGVYFNRRTSRRDHVILFRVRDFRQTAAPKPNWEIRETGFFAAADLPAGTTAATRARLAEVFASAQASQLW